MRRLADLQLEIDEASGGTDLKQSEQRLRRSIALYEAVLKDRPDAPTNDRVLYQLARAYQNVGEADKAETVLQRLTRDYPQSSYIDDAHFRRAELLFKISQFDDAAVEYKYILELARKRRRSSRPPSTSTAGRSTASPTTSRGRGLHQDPEPRAAARRLTDPKAALEGVAKGKKDMAQDALRVISLSFAQLAAAKPRTSTSPATASRRSSRSCTSRWATTCSRRNATPTPP